jgi:hypothetical protein
MSEQQFQLLAPDGSIIARGPLDALMERLPDTTARNDALNSMLRIAADAVQAEEDLEQARASTVKMIANGVAHLTNRFDVLLARRTEQRQADAEKAKRQKQEEIQSYLDTLPDIDAPSTHVPMGDLHSVPPTGSAADPAGSKLRSPGAMAGNDEEQPLLPPEEPLPREGLGTNPTINPAELAHPQKQPSQPISISLNEA